MFDQEIAGFRILMADGKYLCVEGVHKLLSITEEVVSLKLKKHVLKITGRDIKIREIQKGGITLCGWFDGVSLQ